MYIRIIRWPQRVWTGILSVTIKPKPLQKNNKILQKGDNLNNVYTDLSLYCVMLTCTEWYNTIFVNFMNYLSLFPLDANSYKTSRKSSDSKSFLLLNKWHWILHLLYPTRAVSPYRRTQRYPNTWKTGASSQYSNTHFA